MSQASADRQLVILRDEQKANEAACFDYREKMSLQVCAESVLGWLEPR